MIATTRAGKRRVGLALLAVAATAGGMLAGASPASASGPDPSFGTGGKINHRSVAEGYNGVAAGPDESTYQAGFTTVGETDRAVLVTKATVNGALDATFGVGGRKVVNIVPADQLGGGATGAGEVAKGVTTDASGRVLVLGEVEATATSANPDDIDLFVLRLTATGELDPTFGTDGISRISLSDGVGGAGNVRDLATWRLFSLADGKIVFGASKGLDSKEPGRDNRDVAAVRLTATGELDATFGTGGVSVIAKEGNENVRSTLIDSNGKIVIGAYHSLTDADGTGNRPFLYRFDADGTPDATFGTGGIATGNPAGVGGLAEAYGVTQDAAGGYLVSAYGRAGSLPTTHSVDALLFRFTPTGTVDLTWGHTGAQQGITSYYTDPATTGTTDPATTGVADRHRSHLTLPDGRIVGVGHLGADALVTVTLPDGTPDARFGTNGALAVDFGSDVVAQEQFWAVTTVGTGYQIVAAGTSGPGTSSAPILLKVNVDAPVSA